MKAKSFLRLVRSTMPTQSELLKFGMTAEEALGIQSCFIAKKRNAKAAPEVTELERMLIEYDCSTIDLGPVQFRGAVKPTPDGLCFGSSEADPLVILPDGRIALFDHASRDAAPELCAADSERFLDLLAMRITISLEIEMWKGRRPEALLRLAEIAGGQAYFAFCNMICPHPDAL
jgi:hypothetical protein